jgi:glycosyltransferase involved in cell wall biosynthesis
MKLLSIVSYTIFPAKVGGQKGIALFNEYIAKEADLICFTVKSNYPAFAKGYRILNRMGNSPLRYINPRYFFAIRKIIRQEGISHLILEHPYFGWLGILLKKVSGCKLVIHSHNIESLRWKGLGKWWWQILHWYEKITHRLADYNFFIQDADRQYALESFGLKAGKCLTVTYGIEWSEPAAATEKQQCRITLQQKHGIKHADKILLFNGALDYSPNLQALKLILEKINPLLLQNGPAYKIIICGRGLPPVMNNLDNYKHSNIIFAGFVDDITVYFKGADLFINPLVEGGGIKTKLVEAIGYGTPAVSTKNGSIGIDNRDAGPMLRIVDDGNWEAFVNAITTSLSAETATTPPAFYEKFYWGNIVNKAINLISE